MQLRSEQVHGVALGGTQRARCLYPARALLHWREVNGFWLGVRGEYFQGAGSDSGWLLKCRQTAQFAKEVRSAGIMRAGPHDARYSLGAVKDEGGGGAWSARDGAQVSRGFE